MIRYNAAFLYKESPKNCLRIWRDLLKAVKLKDISHNSIISLLKEPRDSYLLGSLPKGTEMEQFMYLKLSSLRNYFDYIESREVTLPLVVGLEYYSKLQILTNRLLIVKNEKIYFKNEEV